MPQQLVEIRDSLSRVLANKKLTEGKTISEVLQCPCKESFSTPGITRLCKKCW